MKVVYIASPYRIGNMTENVAVQLHTLHKIMDLGHCAIAPLLTHFADIFQPRPQEDWLVTDLEIVRRSDAVFRLPGPSKGADGEVAQAVSEDIPVFYTWADLRQWLLVAQSNEA